MQTCEDGKKLPMSGSRLSGIQQIGHQGHTSKPNACLENP